MSGNVCDGLELVRRRYNERLSWISRFPELLGGVPHRCEFSCSQLRYEGSERVVSSQIATSRPGVVVVVENRAPKAFTEPLYHSLHRFRGVWRSVGSPHAHTRARQLRHRIAAHADWVKLTRQGCMHRCRRHVDTQSTDADGAQRHVHRSVRTNRTLNVVALGLVMYCE